MAVDSNIFELTKDHVKLLARMNISYNDNCEIENLEKESNSAISRLEFEISELENELK